MQAYDVVVVGAGIVGLTHALALKNTGLSVAVIDKQASSPVVDLEPKLRVSALTLATENIMRNLAVWPHLEQTRMGQYCNMFVWDQDSFGKISLEAEKVAQQRLGFVIENDHLRHGLWSQAQTCPHIELLVPNSVKSISVGQQECFMTLSDDSHISARLVVGADGANSVVKKQAGFPQTFWDYQQQALVATIQTERPHENVARQVFTPYGPLAFLPLWDKHTSSIVWSQNIDQSQQTMGLDSEEFEKVLAVAFGTELGRCQFKSERKSFPLTMRYTRQWVANRVAVIGDAAHTIHPLAGQGANLGILDAAALAEQIQTLVLENKDFGLAKHLRPFERWRKTEAVKMIGAMEGFKRLFTGQQPILKFARDLGLAAVDNFPYAKNSIIRHAMGLTGELPKLTALENK